MNIQVQKLRKSYKDREVLKNISFEIKEGSICGLLGINGAGKSTIMKIIFGLENADSGTVIFNGKKNAGIYEIGALIETPAIYMNLSAYDNLKTRALLYDISDERINEVLNLIGLSNTGKKKAGSFSLGMKQRLGLGMAIITSPDGIKELLNLMISLKKSGMTILLSSHQLYEVSKVADKVVILHDGQIFYDGSNVQSDDLESLFIRIVHGGDAI